MPSGSTSYIFSCLLRRWVEKTEGGRQQIIGLIAVIKPDRRKPVFGTVRDARIPRLLRERMDGEGLFGSRESLQIRWLGKSIHFRRISRKLWYLVLRPPVL